MDRLAERERALGPGPGERMVHDLENIGSTVLAFTTVELKLGSANAPLPLAVTPEN
jgi:hypothetical protein